MEGEEEEYGKRTAIKNKSGNSPEAGYLSEVDENKCPEFKILTQFELERKKTEYKTNEDLKKISDNLCSSSALDHHWNQN